MATRIIVKNLPSWMNEEKLREVFEEKGNLTDCSIKYSSSGRSRRFAFIGYSTPEDANAAIAYFNNSCIGTSRVKVEVCKNLADVISKNAPPKKTQDDKSHRNFLPEDISSDPKFAEFVQLHQRGERGVWENDLLKNDDAVKQGKAHIDAKNRSLDSVHSEAPKQVENIEDPELSESYASMVKLKNLPYNVSKEQIKQFFCGLNIKRIVMGGKQRKPGESSVIHVEFSDPKVVDQALRRNKSFLGGKKALIARVVRQAKPKAGSAKSAKKSAFPIKDPSQIAADVSDSGRLFVRNLSYLCTEEDIQDLFCKFGELSEVYLPLEKLTKRNKGIAFVSYLMPEHAVKALNDLDGTSFQGRMLHIIPAENKPEPEKSEQPGSGNAGSSFKADKEAALRSTANSSHNWNALFVGSNAVIDTVASEYGAEKKHLFDQSGAAVRMALGETEIVLKTKKFLEEHGVHLEAFGKPVVKRSKTIILVKNLPARTQVDELRQLFGKYGTLARLVLPPSGVTCLIEFSDNNEARSAFKALAYRRFKDLPLYLEWAPVDTFSENAPLLNNIAQSQPEPVKTELTPTTEATKAEPSTTVPTAPEPAEPIVDAGHTTVFIKNLNFKTSEDSLWQLFESKFPGKVLRATIAMNKDSHKQMMSLGYGFVEFADSTTAREVLKKMQHVELDDHKLDLKISTSRNSAAENTAAAASKKNHSDAPTNQPSSRILVRNIPFEANGKDVQELFAVFGNLRSVRLPKKAVVQAIGSVSGRSGGGRATNLHRGFGFVEFHSTEDAKRAFEALRHSTHFYGRRLVLEWAKTDEGEIVDELRAKAAERAVASAAAAAGAVHAGATKRLRKADMVASVEHMARTTKNDDDAGMD